jgi:hypothetical protein
MTLKHSLHLRDMLVCWLRMFGYASKKDTNTPYININPFTNHTNANVEGKNY